MTLSSVCNLKAAVITPYCGEDISIIQRCCESVSNQSYSARHFLVADGRSNELINEFDVDHLILPASHHDFGNTPRALGALSAINRGYDAIFFLDADNWYLPTHVEESMRMKFDDYELDFLASYRQLVLPEGQSVPPDQEDSLHQHVDTSCMCFFEGAFSVIPLWATMTPELSVIGDRIIFKALRARALRIGWTNSATVFYTSRYRQHYERVGLTPPPNAYQLDLSPLAQYDRDKFLAWNGFAFFSQD